MTQLLDRPFVRRAAVPPVRHDYSREHSPVAGLLVALPCGVALWAALALLAYVLVR